MIIFVHGVMGDEGSTWTSGDQYWPTMLTKAPTFNGQNIYVYHYPSPRIRQTFSIDEVADNMRLVLETDNVLRHNEMTFVSHSMGGIVTRAFILKYQRDVVNKIRFLYFFATPTTGSPFAVLTSIVSRNEQFKQLYPMQSDNSYLATLQSGWLAAKFGLKSYCAYEKQPLYGKIIVERQSATNLCTEPIDPIDADHLSIVKPVDQNSTPYRALKAAFKKTVPPPPKARSKPKIDLEFAPIIAIHQSLDEHKNLMKGAQYGVTSILRAEQHNGVSTRHIRSVQVVGDVPADCRSYISSFFKDLHGQYTDDFLLNDCSKRQPFFHLSWIAFPIGQSRIEPNDEEFIRFKISDYFNVLEFAGDPKTYFGFWGTNTGPKYPLTSPYWALLLNFSSFDQDGIGVVPTLRDEVKSGKVKIRVQLDDELMDIPVGQIKRPQTWPDFLVETTLPQDLFYGIDHGFRMDMPSGKDPLVKGK